MWNIEMVYYMKINTYHFITETYCEKHHIFQKNPGFQETIVPKRNLGLVKFSFVVDLMDL